MSRVGLAVGHSASALPSLDLSTGGTFARALAAWYFLQAPNAGATAFLASGTGLAWLAAQTLYVGGDATGANNVTGRYVGASIAQAA